jgi:hypothetical protein
MTTPQLLDFIRKQLAAGSSKEQIQAQLVSSGWNGADIQEAFATVGVGTTPPSVAPATHLSTPAPAQQPPMAATVAPIISRPSNNGAPAMAPIIQPTVVTKSHRGMLWIIVAAIIAILIIGGGAYAFATGQLSTITNLFQGSTSDAPYDKNSVLMGAVQGLSKVSMSSWDIAFHLFTQPRDKDAIPLVFSSDKSTQSSESYVAAGIPQNFDAKIDINGATNKTGNTADAKAGLAVDFTSQGQSLNAAAEFRKVGDNFYAMVSKLPPIFGDYSKILNKWVIITPEDQKNYVSMLSIPVTAPTALNDQQAKYMQQLQGLIALESKDHLLVSDDPQEVSVGGESMYEYDFTLQPNALVPFYKDLMNAAVLYGNATSTVEVSKSTLEYLQSVDGQKMAAYVAKNLLIAIWIDKSGIPRKFEVSLRIVPTDDVTKLAGKQVRFMMDVSLNNINKAVAIAAPSPTISLDEYYKLVTGESLSKALISSRDAKRLADLSYYRMELELYYSKNNVYPTSLSALDSTSISSRMDPLDKTPYGYSKSGSTYTLSTDLESKADAPLYGGGTVSQTSCSLKSNGRFCYRIKP